MAIWWDEAAVTAGAVWERMCWPRRGLEEDVRAGGQVWLRGEPGVCKEPEARAACMWRCLHLDFWAMGLTSDWGHCPACNDA